MCQFTISFVGAVHSLCVPCVLSRSHRARMRSAQRVAHCVMASSSQSIDVPADGLCFYHCVGYALRGGRASFEVSYAETLRAQVCRILTDMGFEQEAVRLKLEGSDGYPDELAFAAAARLLPGRLEVLSQEGILRSYGDGTLRLRVVQVLVYDGAGHGSPHFRVLAMEFLIEGPELKLREGSEGKRCCTVNFFQPPLRGGCTGARKTAPEAIFTY